MNSCTLLPGSSWGRMSALGSKRVMSPNPHPSHSAHAAHTAAVNVVEVLGDAWNYPAVYFVKSIHEAGLWKSAGLDTRFDSHWSWPLHFGPHRVGHPDSTARSEEHTSELQS